MLRFIIPVSIFFVATINSMAKGDLVLAPSSVAASSNLTTGSLVNITNQSGLATTYTSGSTDATGYAPSHSLMNNDKWVSSFTGTNHYLTFDFMSTVTLNSVLIWNAHIQTESIMDGSLYEFGLYADTDNNPTNGSTQIGLDRMLGDVDVATATNAPMQPFTFVDSASMPVSTRFVHLKLISNHADNSEGIGFGEIAFVQVPEPSAFLAVGCSLIAVVLSSSLRKSSELCESE